jgi:hypothetical protein
LILDQNKTSGPESLCYVGTTVCLNSVGVFFEISDTKCFIAHIDAYIVRAKPLVPELDDIPTGHWTVLPETVPMKDPRKYYDTNYRTAERLRTEVFRRLDAVAAAGGWSLRSMRMRNTLFMTCSKMHGQEPQAAEIVAKAVRQWLRTGATPTGKRVAKDGAAFVVGWPGNRQQQYDNAPSTEWVAVDACVGDGDWSFGVEDNGLEGSEEVW